jgi:hypothetical protein
MNYNQRNLWDLFLQPVTIFNWKNILEEWDNSLLMPHHIQVVVDNLRAASDSDSTHEIPFSTHEVPLRHFMDYLNYEEEAVVWFLYEVVTLRWSWGETRLDFVKELLRNHRDCFDLESTFPDFPGSPRQSQTVREFLVAFLNTDEQNYVQIPPRRQMSTFNTLSEAFEAIRKNKDVEETQPQSPSFHSVSDETENLEKENQIKELKRKNKKLRTQNKKLTEENNLLGEAIENLQDDHEIQHDRITELVENLKNTLSKDLESFIPVEEQMPKYAPFTIQFNRESGNDDKVMIRKVNDDEYNIIFWDTESNIRHKISSVNKDHVFNYLESTLRFMRYDCNPYDKIQVYIPAGPSVLVEPKMTIQMREALFDCLETTMDNWPIII